MTSSFSIKIKIVCHGHPDPCEHEVDLENVARFLGLFSKYGHDEDDGTQQFCIERYVEKYLLDCS